MIGAWSAALQGSGRSWLKSRLWASISHQGEFRNHLEVAAVSRHQGGAFDNRLGRNQQVHGRHRQTPGGDAGQKLSVLRGEPRVRPGGAHGLPERAYALALLRGPM